MKTYKIFSTDYLSNNELTETDLYYLFDTPSFNYSLIINMFKFMDIKLTNDEILKLCKADNSWIFKYHWTAENRERYKQILINIFKNVYQTTKTVAENSVDSWLLSYGFAVRGENLFAE